MISVMSVLSKLLLRGAVNNLHNPRCSPSTSRATEKSKDIYFLPGIVYKRKAPGKQLIPDSLTLARFGLLARGVPLRRPRPGPASRAASGPGSALSWKNGDTYRRYMSPFFQSARAISSQFTSPLNPFDSPALSPGICAGFILSVTKPVLKKRVDGSERR